MNNNLKKRKTDLGAKFYQKDKRVQSIMIEIRRDLYMDEIAGKKSSNFEDIKNLMRKLIRELETKFSL